MIDQLDQLEAQARLLEPNDADRERLRQQVLAYTEQFLNTIHSEPAHLPRNDANDPFEAWPIGESPRELNEIMGFVGEHVDGTGLNPASGGHLGYIPGGGIYTSALGDYMADITNRYAGVYQPGPGAVRMENALISWMAELVGYPKTAGGNLASGGSIANLIAIVTARKAHGIKAKDYERAVIYMSGQRHHCVDKAIRIAGMEEAQIRFIPLDDRYRAKPDWLEAQIAQDKANGLHPWLVIGNAGSTDTGAIDPLDELGRIANEANCWYHIDAAYGGFFVLTDEGRAKLHGMHRSDSIAMDPHKGLFLPYGLGAVIVKDIEPLAEAHHYQANYIQNDTSILSPADLSPELTKHFRGMRLWLPLQIHGLAPFRACLQEKLVLARYFREQLMQVDDWIVGPEPDLSVVIYRFAPPGMDQETANRLNEQIAKSVIDDGRVFISWTTIDGVVWLRLAVLAFRTHRYHIDVLLEQLKQAASLQQPTT